MAAPVIPGLNDHEIPAILAAAAEAGAATAGYTLLRLPGAVQPVFLEWLERTRPDSRERIENAIRSIRGGALNSPEFGKRMSGAGLLAEQVRKLFRAFAAKHGLNGRLPEYDCGQFRPPAAASGQMRLF
jgi:DNA repair photolyase